MLVVGLTGGIATGKSSVSRLIKAKDIRVVDADVLARQVVEPGTPALKKIVQFFGPEVLQPDGSLDRKKLGSIIFNDEAKRRKLNSIVHPAVRWAMFIEVVKNWVGGERFCVLDVPLLIEGPLWKWVGVVIVVYCPEDLQLQRLMSRDGSTLEDATARLNSQRPIAEKVLYADHVVDNSGSLKDLEKQVDVLVEKLHRDSGWIWWLVWIFPPFGLVTACYTLALRALRRWWRPVRIPVKKSD